MTLTVEKFVKDGFGWTIPSPNSSKNYLNHIRQFERFLSQRGKRADDGSVSTEDIQDYIDHMKSKFRQNSVATKMAAVSSYFKWLKKEGVITHYPTIKSQPRIPIQHKIIPHFAMDKLTKLKEAKAPRKIRDAAMIALITRCGYRSESVVTINLGDVDCETRKIGWSPAPRAFPEIANYYNLRVAMGRELVTMESPFFLNKHNKRISSRSMRRHIQKIISDTTGMDHFTMRDLQYTAQQTEMDRFAMKDLQYTVQQTQEE